MTQDETLKLLVVRSKLDGWPQHVILWFLDWALRRGRADHDTAVGRWRLHLKETAPDLPSWGLDEPRTVEDWLEAHGTCQT